MSANTPFDDDLFPGEKGGIPYFPKVGINPYLTISPFSEYKWQNLKYTSKELEGVFFVSSDVKEVGPNKEDKILIEPDCLNGIWDSQFYIVSSANVGNVNVIGDQFLYKVVIAISKDALKLETAWECVSASENELILLIEDNTNDWSSQKMYCKVGSSAKSIILAGHSDTLVGEINTRVQGFSLSKLQRLLENGKVEYDWAATESIINGVGSFFNFVNYVPSKLGDLCNYLGEGIVDNLTLPEETWNSEDKEYWFNKGNIISVLQIDTETVYKFLEPLQTNKIILYSDFSSVIIQQMSSGISSSVINIVNQYNKKVSEIVEDLFATIAKQKKTKAIKYYQKYLSYSVARLCGIWNGLVDFVGSIFSFVGSILKLPRYVANNGGMMLEMIDNLTDTLRLLDFDKIWDAMIESYSKFEARIEKLNIEDINTDKLGYYIGYGMAFIASFFIPFTQIAKIGKISQVGRALLPAKYLEEISTAINKTGSAIGKAVENATDDILILLDRMLLLLAKGKEDLVKFFDEILEVIVSWFKKNPKAFRAIIISDEALITLSKMADDALKLAKAIRPNACGVLEGEGVAIYNFSAKLGLPPGKFPKYNHKLVDEWVQEMWAKHLKGEIKLPEYHGKCAEVMNIDEYLHSIDPNNRFTIDEARKALEGFVSHARQIGDMPKKKILHKDYKKACDSCIDILKDFGIAEYKIN